MKLPFEIRRRSPMPLITLVTPTGTGYPIGTAMQESATAGTAELADGTKVFAGFMTRQSIVGGPTLGDDIFPGRLQLGVAAGDPDSFERGEEIECEGASYVDAGITGSTALKTPLSFAAGKFCVAGSGQYAQFELVELPAPVTAGNVRIRVVPLAAFIKP
ncbi:MAG TPA: hypothetical protein VH413_16310 [Verrucomicrobiae bacterium]|jgi:hypothetical protein|nr:hypothetical protein [Verrucomicrobiae bacterium]